MRHDLMRQKKVLFGLGLWFVVEKVVECNTDVLWSCAAAAGGGVSGVVDVVVVTAKDRSGLCRRRLPSVSVGRRSAVLPPPNRHRRPSRRCQSGPRRGAASRRTPPSPPKHPPPTTIREAGARRRPGIRRDQVPTAWCTVT